MQLHGRQIGLDQPIFLIAGPCVIESEDLQLRTAERLKAITDKLVTPGWPEGSVAKEPSAAC